MSATILSFPGRCALQHAACAPSGKPLQPTQFVPCGRPATPDHEGIYLCADHMAWWYCQHCGALTPECFQPYHSCAPCYGRYGD
jgi:hypothetical protein